MIYPEGTITKNSQGNFFIKKDGKWEYLKKPKKDWKSPSKKSRKKISPEYPPIKIPEGGVETEYPGYYITEDGRAYRKPRKCDATGRYGEPDENGLIYLKPGLRGLPKHPEHQYECVNISIYNDTGNYKQQIRRSIHQLVAQTFIPNPDNHNEIDHIDKNKLNNHYTNLRWISRFENASSANPKSYTITDTITDKIWKGTNLSEWLRFNYDLVHSRTKKKNQTINDMAKRLASVRCKDKKIWGLIVEY